MCACTCTCTYLRQILTDVLNAIMLSQSAVRFYRYYWPANSLAVPNSILSSQKVISLGVMVMRLLYPHVCMDYGKWKLVVVEKLFPVTPKTFELSTLKNA